MKHTAVISINKRAMTDVIRNGLIDIIYKYLKYTCEVTILRLKDFTLNNQIFSFPIVFTELI